VARWDERNQVLIPVLTTLPGVAPPNSISVGQGVGGQAAQQRRPVISNDYPRYSAAVPAMVDAGVQAALSAPLLYADRLLGVVTIVATTSGTLFSQTEADGLELFAGMAAALLVGLERSRLEGALLAARTAQHALNNHLSAVIGYTELVSADSRLPADALDLLNEAIAGAHAAAQTLAQIQRITQWEEIDRGAPGGLVLDLSQSTSPPAGKSE
jgi:GAF domain-containing protein